MRPGAADEREGPGWEAGRGVWRDGDETTAGVLAGVPDAGGFAPGTGRTFSGSEAGDDSVATGTGHYFDDPLHQGFDSSAVTGNTIDVGQNVFTNGQAVVYHNGGGASIDGLTDGGVYYVIKLSDTTVQLAQSAASSAFDPASARDPGD